MSPSELASLSQLRTLREADNFKQIAVLLKTIKPQSHSLDYCIELPEAVSSRAHNVQAIVDFLTTAIKPSIPKATDSIKAGRDLA
jgi:hypothetical protein